MSVVAVCLVAVLVAAVSGVPAVEKYTTKWDNIDVDQVLHNDRLLLNYFNCLIGEGTCTKDGEDLKKNIPDALETGCSKCSEKQKIGTEKVVKFLLANKPEMYEKFEKIYDAKGIFRQRYREEASKYGIKV